jgi:hypothetical protein
MTLLLLSACFFLDEVVFVDDTGGEDTGPPDADGDGSPDDEDCDDAAADVHPGAPEACGDDVDNDCDGLIGACEARFTADAVADRAGYSLSGAGDVDADGYADMVVASPGTQVNTGTVFLIRGRATPTDATLSAADAVYTGETAGDFAGNSVSGAGDVNADGYADLLIGVPCESGCAGGAWILLGSATPTSTPLSGADAWLDGGGAYPMAGASVAGVGDTNGDGFDDVVVGAPSEDASSSHSGAAGLVLGSASPIGLALDDADAGYFGETEGDRAGSAVAGAGDVDGDGLDDLLVGAPYADDDAGAAWLVLGSAEPSSRGLGGADARYAGVAEGDLAGWSVASAGDTNGDGLADILIGAPEHAGTGVAFLVLGSAAPGDRGLADADAAYSGVPYAQAGKSVAAAGDLDGDGNGDFLIGSPYAPVDGAAYVVLGGSPGGELPSSAAATFERDGLAGWSVAGVGDVNRDGQGDVLVGAPWNDDAGGKRGVVFLELGGGL